MEPKGPADPSNAGMTHAEALRLPRGWHREAGNAEEHCPEVGDIRSQQCTQTAWRSVAQGGRQCRQRSAGPGGQLLSAGPIPAPQSPAVGTAHISAALPRPARVSGGELQLPSLKQKAGSTVGAGHKQGHRAACVHLEGGEVRGPQLIAGGRPAAWGQLPLQAEA